MPRPRATGVPSAASHDTVAREPDARDRRPRAGSSQQRAGLAARHERAVGAVAAIEERLAHEGQPGGAAARVDLAAESEHRQRPPERVGEAPRPPPATAAACAASDDDGVVQRAVRLDVADVGARHRRAHASCAATSAVSSAGVEVQRTAPEVRGIGVRRMRADRDPEPRRPVDGVAHGRGIPRVPAAGDARARDDREHRLVVGGRHAGDGLAEVGVEVDRGHAPTVPRVAAAPAMRRAVALG